ncbi:hypothetical protein [Paraburkholderia dipogonis]|uniref:hypothetical protein n=1 Tax=Paraburkholderia dipogonis TaxID=1211383 RepID=UPI0038BDB8BB
MNDVPRLGERQGKKERQLVFPENFLHTGMQITDEQAMQLVKFRNEYAYPAARLVLDDHAGDFKLPGGQWAKIVPPAQGDVTDATLDAYHERLLRSSNATERLLGTASIVLWGFYTFSPAFAAIRVHRHLFGRGNQQATSAGQIADVLEEADNAVKAGNPGRALEMFAGINQLGRTPFASKVIALLDPRRTAVYDNRICKGLQNSPWAANGPFANGVGAVQLRRVQREYASWCSFTQAVAEQLNEGCLRGLPWHWRDRLNGPQMWRAIDVERAIFAMFEPR